MNNNYFAACAPGMEPLLAQEMTIARFLNITPVLGGVEFDGALTELYRANLQLRLASHILIRLGSFQAVGFPELKRKSARLPWENYLKPGQPVTFRVTCHKSKLYHSGAVAERLADAIAARLGQPLRVIQSTQSETEVLPQIILVRLDFNECTISLDSSGTPLHRRGYRQATGKAPLRENLAAGLLLASGWDGQSPLVDPFCGVGTIAIEAAMFARKIIPGVNREFTFMNWPRFVRRAWNLLLEENQTEPPAAPEIFAADRDAGAVNSARENATRADVAEFIKFTRQTISDFTAPPGPGWIVTNPPYGVRTKNAPDLRNLYARFGDVLRAQCPGWHVAVVANDGKLIRQTGLALKPVLTTENGGLKVQFFAGKVLLDT